MGGIAARNQPGDAYALGLGAAKPPFTYTPFAALLFSLRGAVACSRPGRSGLAVLTIGLLPVVAYLSLGTRRAARWPGQGGGGVCDRRGGLWLEPVATSFFGQINSVLVALVVGDLALPDRFRGKGIGIGLAAAIKLTPLIFIPYLLLTRRVRAAVVSALTFGATIGLGFALLPHASAVYWGGKVTRPGSRAFHLDNQSLNGVILRLTHVEARRARVLAGRGGRRRHRRARHLDPGESAAATSYSAWLRAPRPACWYPRHLVAPLRLRDTGAFVLAAYGPRALGYRILGAALVVSLSAGGPYLLATRAATTLRPSCCRAGGCFLRRTAVTEAQSSSPGVGWN